MDTVNLQQAFDNAVRGIYKQGGPAWVPPGPDTHNGTCAYRVFDAAGSVTAKCGIGHSIPDSLYNEAIEGDGIRTIMNAVGDDEPVQYQDVYDDIADHFRAISVDDLDQLQMVHDLAAQTASEHRAPFMEDFLSGSVKFAHDHNLTWPADVPLPD